MRGFGIHQPIARGLFGQSAARAASRPTRPRWCWSRGHFHPAHKMCSNSIAHLALQHQQQKQQLELQWLGGAGLAVTTCACWRVSWIRPQRLRAGVLAAATSATRRPRSSSSHRWKGGEMVVGAVCLLTSCRACHRSLVRYCAQPRASNITCGWKPSSSCSGRDRTTASNPPHRPGGALRRPVRPPLPPLPVLPSVRAQGMSSSSCHGCARHLSTTCMRLGGQHPVMVRDHRAWP